VLQVRQLSKKLTQVRHLVEQGVQMATPESKNPELQGQVFYETEKVLY
jgi:hypothetical protein